jgi:hypothetical protein
VRERLNGEASTGGERRCLESFDRGMVIKIRESFVKRQMVIDLNSAAASRVAVTFTAKRRGWPSSGHRCLGVESAILDFL